MADPNQGQLIATAWEKVIGKSPSDQIFKSRALYKALGKSGFKEGTDGGRQIEFTLEYAENSTFKSYDELETLDTTRINVFDCARYDWKVHAGTIVFSELERLRAAGDSSKMDNYVSEKLENGRDSHTADLNVAMFLDGTGNGGKDINGLTGLISETPTTGTVGQINRATFSFWRNKAVAGTKTTSAFDNLQSSMRSCYNQCSNGGVEFEPTAGITSRTVFEGFEGTLTTLERYAKDSNKERGATAGFANDALRFKSADVMYDEDCSPSDSLYFINPKFLKFVYLQGAWMKMKAPVEPANQLAQVYRVFTMGQLGTNCSRRLGVVYDVT